MLIIINDFMEEVEENIEKLNEKAIEILLMDGITSIDVFTNRYPCYDGSLPHDIMIIGSIDLEDLFDKDYIGIDDIKISIIPMTEQVENERVPSNGWMVNQYTVLCRYGTNIDGSMIGDEPTIISDINGHQIKIAYKNKRLIVSVDYNN